MTFRDILPINREKKDISVRRDEWSDPFFTFRRDLNRVFDNFFDDFDVLPALDRSSSYYPSIDIRETDKEYVISAELPGLDDKDIDVSISNNVLRLKGEKKLEKENKGENYYRVERSYGSFHREIPLPSGVENNKIEASFKKGVLDIHLPKKPEAQQKVKRVEIKAG